MIEFDIYRAFDNPEAPPSATAPQAWVPWHSLIIAERLPQ
jgi:hypothetical protein